MTRGFNVTAYGQQLVEAPAVMPGVVDVFSHSLARLVPFAADDPGL